jgi:hypothetical protein
LKNLFLLNAFLLLTACSFSGESKSSVLTTSSAPNPKLFGTWFSGALPSGGSYNLETSQWQGRTLADRWTYQLILKDSQTFSFFVHYLDVGCVAVSFYIAGSYEVKDSLLILTPEVSDRNQRALGFCWPVLTSPYTNLDDPLRPEYFYRFRFTGEAALELTMLRYNKYEDRLEVDPENAAPIILTREIL